MMVAADINCYHGLYTLEETIGIMAGAGFDAIDFSFMEESQYNEDTDGALFRQKFTDLRKFAEDRGLCFIQAHAPCPSSTDDAEETEKIFGNIVRSIRETRRIWARRSSWCIRSSIWIIPGLACRSSFSS